MQDSAKGLHERREKYDLQTREWNERENAQADWTVRKR
jgi:hypothetical protein